MVKNTIKNLGLAALVGLGTILPNQDAKADGRLFITNNIGANTSFVRLFHGTNSAATDGYNSGSGLDSVYSDPFSTAPGIYSEISGNSPTNRLSLDVRNNSSSTPFKIRLAFKGENSTSVTNYLTFGFSGTNQFQHKQFLTLRELDNSDIPTTNSWDLKYLGTNGIALPLTNFPPVTNSSLTTYRSFQVDFDDLKGPIATSADTITRNLGTSNKIQKSNLLTNDVDPNGYTLRLLSFSPTSSNGLALVDGGSFIGYPATTNRLNDSFSYTVTNDHGSSATGLVNVLVNTNVTGQMTSLVPSSNSVSGTSFGIPNYPYDVLRSTNMIDWTTITNITAPANGVMKFTDNFSDIGGVAPDSAFYKLRYNP